MGVYGGSTFRQGDPVTPSAHSAPASSMCTTLLTVGNLAVSVSTSASTTSVSVSLARRRLNMLRVEAYLTHRAARLRPRLLRHTLLQASLPPQAARIPAEPGRALGTQRVNSSLSSQRVSCSAPLWHSSVTWPSQFVFQTLLLRTQGRTKYTLLLSLLHIPQLHIVSIDPEPASRLVYSDCLLTHLSSPVLSHMPPYLIILAVFTFAENSKFTCYRYYRI